jgi:hypothetical protein
MKAAIMLVCFTICVPQCLPDGFLPSAGWFEHQEPKIIEQDQNNCVIETSDRNRMKKEGEIRELIWSDWRQNSGPPGRYRVQQGSVPSKNSFVVELDQQGTWSLKVMINCPTLKGTIAAYPISRLRY